MSLVEKAGAEPQPSFEEQQRQAEEAAGIPSDVELYGEWMAQPEPDPETGLKPSPSRPVEAETEPEAEAQAAPEPEETVEAVEEEKPDQLAELNKKLGQLLNENAELRKQQAEREQEPPQFQPQPLTQEAVGYFDEYAAENPVEAVRIAVQQQQPILYERAIRAWYEQDPVAAGRYERQAELAVAQQRWQQQFQPQIAAAQQVANEHQFESALSGLASKYEDFQQVIGTIAKEDAETILNEAYSPEIVESLLATPAGKEKAMATLYHWVKARRSETFKAAAEQAAETQAEEAKQAKRDATVASATTTTPAPVPETEEERLQQVFKDLRPNMRAAWTGRTAR